MDLFSFVVFFSTVVCTEAIKCHDCTSWNPYCRDEVNEPFPDAVATVECEKTSTCFLKKETNGVISRGCSDWWMESQVDIQYVGCQSQTLPWLGKQIWCFCKDDYCNGGSVSMMEAGIYPKKVRQNLVQDPWDNQFEWPQWQEHSNTLNSDPNIVQGNRIQEGQVFDDVNPGSNLKNMEETITDPAFKVWWWHAESDRPKFSDFDRRWKAPKWVQRKDGLGWDLPMTKHDRVKTTEKWGWGQGWGQILPWWSGRFTNTQKTRPTTATTWDWITTRRTIQTMPTTPTITSAGAAVARVVQNEGEDNSIVDVNAKGDLDLSNNIIDSQLEVADFFCWDCYSDSPHCGERVNTIKAHYLGKTQCSSTNKCFVRRQGNVIYRGCADGWQNSATSIDYEGCRVQQLWGQPVEWCFCTASLCNGDAMEDIKSIYMQHIHPHPYKSNGTNNSTISSTLLSTKQTSKHSLFSKPATLRLETSTLSTTADVKTVPAPPSTTSATAAATTTLRRTQTIRHYNYKKPSRRFTYGTSTENTIAARNDPSLTENMFAARKDTIRKELFTESVNK